MPPTTIVLNASITSYRPGSGQTGAGEVVLGENVVPAGVRIGCYIEEASLHAQSRAAELGVRYDVNIKVSSTALARLLASATVPRPAQRDQLVVQRPGLGDVTVMVADVIGWTAGAAPYAGAMALCTIRGRVIQ